jgi:hypothetical protein
MRRRKRGRSRISPGGPETGRVDGRLIIGVVTSRVKRGGVLQIDANWALRCGGRAAGHPERSEGSLAVRRGVGRWASGQVGRWAGGQAGREWLSFRAKRGISRLNPLSAQRPGPQGVTISYRLPPYVLSPSVVRPASDVTGLRIRVIRRMLGYVSCLQGLLDSPSANAGVGMATGRGGLQ